MNHKPRYSFHDQHIERVVEERSRLKGAQNLEANSYILQRFRKIVTDDTDRTDFHFNSLAWDSSGSKLIGSTPCKITSWFQNLEQDFEYENPTHRDISCVKFLPNSLHNGFVFANNSHIWIYDSQQTDPKKIVKCHSDTVFNLAFPNGNPKVLLSSSVDGTVRQHDLREKKCSKGQCNKVLLDLRRVKRNSLAEVATNTEEFILCSSDLSPSSNFIFVGGNDCFGRLYDIRLVRAKSQSINYYCPKHLSVPFNVQKPYYGRKKPIQVAKVAFSPQEWEVLISYSQEHIYVMNINHDGVNEDLYSPYDVVQMYKVDANTDRPTRLDESERDIKMRNQVKKLLEGCSAHESIDILDAFLSMPGRPIGDGVIYEWLCCRAKFLIERGWKNDAHMAIRDCDRARKIKGDYEPFLYLSKALLELGRVKEALQSANVAKSLSPSNPDVNKLLKLKRFRPRVGSIAESEVSQSWIDGGRRTNWSQGYKAIDMKQRFIGHENAGCDAYFLGPTGDYIISGSADNRLYIWEKISGRLVRTVEDREPLGKVLRCHPRDFVVATGSDTVKLWAPGPAGVEPDVADDLRATKENQRNIKRSS